jgi:protein-S-isoprenylcysteine O-methyltransferase Ste14
MVAPERVVDVLWLAWAVSWMVAAAWSDRALKRPAVGQEIVYRLLVLFGAMCLFGFLPPFAFMNRVLWRLTWWLGWGLVAIATVGFAFTWTARIYLGRLWSSSVTRKVDHHVVDSGPYALVRHPIYSGLILSTVATAAIRGRASALAGAALICFGWYIKARLEERFLREQLGRDAYDGYARRVPMLVPFTRRWRAGGFVC